MVLHVIVLRMEKNARALLALPLVLHRALQLRWHFFNWLLGD